MRVPVAAAGMFMLVCGTMKSEFIVYRLLVAQSQLLWGEDVHRFFYQVTRLMLVALSQWKKRRQWSSADKMRIVLAGMEAGTEISELCRVEGISPTQYYSLEEATGWWR